MVVDLAQLYMELRLMRLLQGELEFQLRGFQFAHYCITLTHEIVRIAILGIGVNGFFQMLESTHTIVLNQIAFCRLELPARRWRNSQGPNGHTFRGRLDNFPEGMHVDYR